MMEREKEGQSIAVRTLIRASVVLLLVGGVLLVGFTANVFLTFFLAVLFAVFLRGVSCWMARHARLSPTGALALTVGLLLVLLVLGAFLLAPGIAKEMSSLASELPKAAEQFENKLRSYEWGRQLLGKGLNSQQLISSLPNTLSKAGLFLSSTLGLIVNLLVIFFVGLYLAAGSKLYMDGFLTLLPESKVERGREVLLTLGTTLQRWLMGRLILMVSNGIITAIGLALLGVPLAVPLGIISGVLNFIPNIGPILAAVPTLLLAWAQGPTVALYVVIFYVVYQMLDGYVLTPVVEKWTVAMPPALTIMAQVLLGVVLGFMGVLLAVPLVAVVMVVVKMLYVEDTLGKKIKVSPGND